MTTSLSEKGLRVAVARLESDVLAAQEEREDLRDERDSLCSALDQARAEVERLRTEQDTFLSGHVATLRGRVEYWREATQRAETSLAAANALLKRVDHAAKSFNVNDWDVLRGDISAHLA